MGSAQSSVTQQVEADYTDIVNSTINSIINKSTLECSSTQVLEVCPGCIPISDTQAPIICPLTINNGGFTVNQVGNVTCNLGSENTTKLSNDLKTNLTSATEQWIENNYSNYQGWFAIAFNSQTANNTQISQISQEITNDITNDISNLCSAELNSYQFLQVPICGIFNNVDFVFNQDNATTSITSCINNNIINNAIKNTVIASAIQRADDYFASRQEGPLDWIKYVIIGVVVIVVIIIIGAILIAVKVV